MFVTLQLNGFDELTKWSEALKSKGFYNKLSQNFVNSLAGGARVNIIKNLKAGKGKVFKPKISRHIESSFLVSFAPSNNTLNTSYFFIKGQANFPGLSNATFKGAKDYLAPHIAGLNINKRVYKWLENQINTLAKGPKMYAIGRKKPRTDFKDTVRKLFHPNQNPSNRYFLLKKFSGRLRPGIYSDNNKKLSLIYSLYRDVSYFKKPFKFYENVLGYIDRNADRRFEAAFKETINNYYLGVV